MFRECYRFSQTNSFKSFVLQYIAGFQNERTYINFQNNLTFKYVTYQQANTHLGMQNIRENN